MPEDVISHHGQDHKPLHGNTLPVAECDVHDTSIAGKPCKAIDVPILSCASIWLRVQREAEAWIAPGGKLIADPVARNRRINQAYAQLWQADHRFQWAGLAAFASKQVGCGLLHAADNIRQAQEEINMNARRPDILSNADGAAVNAMPETIAGSSAYMHQQLALGNTTLFLDIYPLHRFFMLRGLDHLSRCLKQRSSIKQQVVWPVEETKLPFGAARKEIVEAFELISNGRIAESVKKLAYHEQVNILQAAIYDDTAMRIALDANQFSWVTDFPSGTAAEIKLALSAECRSSSETFNIWFSKNKTARLYEKNQRMVFVVKAADRFDALLHGDSRTALEASLSKIAASGGY